MTDTPHIDDRRRFKELWQELLFARILAAAAVGGFFQMMVAGPRLPYMFAQFVGVALIAAAPSALASRSWAILLSASAVAYAGLIVVTFGSDADQIATFATVGAAVGVVEGLADRSIATACTGLTGGALAWALGGLASFQLHYWLVHLPDEKGWGASQMFPGMIVVVLGHLGIGLSLALGRYIRDLPKRKQDEPEPTE